MRPNRLSHILKSSMNIVLFVNATIGFSENLFLVCIMSLITIYCAPNSQRGYYKIGITIQR